MCEQNERNIFFLKDLSAVLAQNIKEMQIMGRFLLFCIFFIKLIVILKEKMKEQFEEIEVFNFNTKKKKKNKDQGEKAKEEKDEEKRKLNDRRYKDLLKRVVETLTKYNPDLGEKTKIAIQPPQVIKQGAKKTAITNFQNICHTLNRHPDHVMNFILQDLGGSSGSIGNQGLVIKNILTQRQVENMIKKYISEFVQCQLCRKQSTQLKKDDKMRIWTIHCNSCFSTRSVRTIKGAQKKYESHTVATEEKEEEERK